MSLTHRGQRRARKRAVVRLADGGYTSQRRAREYVLDGRARLNKEGALEFITTDPKHRTVRRLILRERDPLANHRFEWHPGISGGANVMKARSRIVGNR